MSAPVAVVLLSLERDLDVQIDSRCELRRVAPGARRPEVLAALAEAEGVLLSNMVVVDEEFLEAAPRLRVVSGFGVGYNNFDVEAATRRGIAVCNTAGVLTPAVADLMIGLMIALARRLFDFEAYARSGGWAARKRPPPLAFDLAGKTLGVVGFGRIGKEVTRRVVVFGMRTLWNDVFSELPAGAPESEYRDLDDLLRESDIVTLHTDLNPTSHHLIGERELGLMKPEACLINTSRGPIIDQPALTAALQNGSIAAAALDVLEKEPPDPDDPIVRLPNALTFPHIGTATHETRRLMRELSVRNLLAVLEGKDPESCVNPDVLGRG